MQTPLQHAAKVVGTPVFLAVTVAAVASGIFFRFSDTWWNWIDRGINVLTLWIGIVIQHAQNRDTEAIQMKLDAIVTATPADNNVRGIEK